MEKMDIRKLLEIKTGDYSFMNNGIVNINVESTLVTFKIKKLPDDWNVEKGLSLGYSSNYLAYRKCSGLQGFIRFCDEIVPKMKINLTKVIEG